MNDNTNLLSNLMHNKTVICFIFFYLSIFGPKIGTYFDVSVLANITSLLITIYKNYNKKQLILNNNVINLFLIVALVILYTIIISLFTGNIIFTFVLKFVRVFLAIAGIYAFIELQKYEKSIVFDAIGKVLLVHAITIIIGSTVWLNLQNLMRPITGFEKMELLFRSTGFTNGYDFAGLLCIFGIIITSYLKNKGYKTLYLLIFILASFLTSRITMIIAEFLIVFMLIWNKKRITYINKLLLESIFALSIFPVLGIFLVSTMNFDNLIVQTMLKNSFFSEVSKNIVYHYASSNIEKTIQRHFDFSRLSFTEIWLGAMEDSQQDPGYTQYVYAIGIVGVSISLLFYFYIAIETLIERHADEANAIVIILICFLCLLLSVKNSYLFARHVTEVLLILFMSQHSQKNVIISNRRKLWLTN